MNRKIALSIEEMTILKIKGMDICDASMCWIRESNTDTYKLTVHDEYCYEMGCLNPVPAYTLQDIILKLNGEISPTNIETINEYPDVAKPWLFSANNFKNNGLNKSICMFGETPLDAAFAVLLKAWESNPKRVKHLTGGCAKDISLQNNN